MVRAGLRAALLLAVGFFAAPAVPAQVSAKPSPAKQAIDPAFLKIQSERTAAMHTGDIEVYARYTTENFWVVMPDGSVQTKKDRMAAMAAAKNTPASSSELSGAPPREEKVNAYGSTVVVSWIEAIRGKDARFSETWVKDGGTWKVAAAHVSMIQAKP
jgi:Domain of unknown function (DUF4440)